MKKIVMFYGQECPHCHIMMHAVEDLNKDEEIEIEKCEVWHNEENAERMRSYKEIIGQACGGDLGVPAFLDEDEKRAICGEMPHEKLKQWINEK